MLDTIIVVAIVAAAAVFVGRKLYRQFTAKSGCGCGCSGCGQSGSCDSQTDAPTHDGCCGSR